MNTVMLRSASAARNQSASQPLSPSRALAQTHDQQPALATAVSMKFRVQNAFGASDMSGNSPFFEKPGRCSVRFEMCRIDHQRIRRLTLRRKVCDYLIERAKPAATDEAVVDRPGGAVFSRRITLPQFVSDDEANAAFDPPIIDTRPAMRR